MAQAYPQVLVSQRTYFQLQAAYLVALHNVWRSAIALQNFTLSGGLEVPASSASGAATASSFGSEGGQE
jgi:cobalt-zinc-cadmium efflux system outer membrane protein